MIIIIIIYLTSNVNIETYIQWHAVFAIGSARGDR